MAKYEWYNGKVVDILDETPTIKRFFIEIPEVEDYEFRSGQFTMLDLPITGKVTTRQYSIASKPNSGNVIELIIVLNEHGAGTPYLFKDIQIGSTIKTSSALGKFVLPDSLDKDLCFICTGVGIAPFRAMLMDIIENNIPHKNIYMVFGTRYKIDLCYAHQMKQLAEEYDFFHYIPTLSRENGEWDGNRGYVHEVYKELFADGRPATFFICGWKNMIFEARDFLHELGYERSDIKYELYD